MMIYVYLYIYNIYIAALCALCHLPELGLLSATPSAKKDKSYLPPFGCKIPYRVYLVGQTAAGVESRYHQLQHLHECLRETRTISANGRAEVVGRFRTSKKLGIGHSKMIGDLVR